jgi:hypothetical protein
MRTTMGLAVFAGRLSCSAGMKGVAQGKGVGGTRGWELCRLASGCSIITAW